MYQAGTLSANPLAMCAGLAALQRLRDGRIYARLESLGARLERALGADPRLAVQRVGSIFWLCFSEQGQPLTPMRTLQSFPVDAGEQLSQALPCAAGTGDLPGTERIRSRFPVCGA